MRTHRQRNVIEALIHSIGNLSLSQLNSLANTLLPALTTDMSNTEILSELVNVPEYASYPIDQRMLPIENEAGDSYEGIVYRYGTEMYSIDWDTNPSRSAGIYQQLNIYSRFRRPARVLARIGRLSYRLLELPHWWAYLSENPTVAFDLFTHLSSTKKFLCYNRT